MNLGVKQRICSANGEERAALIDGLPYDVGFGKPPRSTRFKPGNTYGRRGRPKGAENLQTILAEEFEAKIEVNDAGRRRKLSKRRVAVRQLANKVASGDTKAFTLYVELLRKTGQLAPSETSEAPAMDARDLEAIQRLAAIFGTKEPTDTDESGQP